MKNVQHVNSFPNCDELIFLNINSYCHTLQISFKAQSKKKKNKHVSVEQFSPGLC